MKKKMKLGAFSHIENQKQKPEKKKKTFPVYYLRVYGRIIFKIST